MRVHLYEQGSPDWLQARVGVLSSSRCGPLMTAGGKRSTGKGAETLVVELVGETLLGRPLDEASSPWMDRGTDLEGEARDWLSMTVAPVEEVGFCVYDGPGKLNGRVGASPDGLIENAATVEIKCPSAKNHIRYLLKPEELVAAYRHQVQMTLLVTGFAEAHMVSYCPGLPTVHTMVWPDNDYQAQLLEALEWAVDRVDESVAKIEAMRSIEPLDELGRAALEVFG